MGRLQGLLLAAGGEASNSSALAQWRLAVSAHLDDPDTVNVHSLADLPAPVGSIITLAANTCYVIHGLITRAVQPPTARPPRLSP